MTTRFSYSGTSPATVYSCVRDPDAAGLSISKKWMSPMIESAGGVRFVYDKNVVKSIMTLTWSHIDTADLAGILSFLAVVGYGANAFDFTDPAGGYWTAQFFGPDKLTWVETDVDNRSFTIELLITEKPNLITNGIWAGASGVTPPTDWFETLGVPTFSVSGEWLTIIKGANYNPGICQPVTTVAGKTYIFRANSISGTASAVASARVGTTLGGVDLGTDQNPLVLTEHDLEITFVATGTTTYVSLHNTTTVSDQAKFATPALYEIGAV